MTVFIFVFIPLLLFMFSLSLFTTLYFLFFVIWDGRWNHVVVKMDGGEKPQMLLLAAFFMLCCRNLIFDDMFSPAVFQRMQWMLIGSGHVVVMLCCRREKKWRVMGKLGADEAACRSSLWNWIETVFHFYIENILYFIFFLFGNNTKKGNSWTRQSRNRIDGIA